MIVNTCPTSPIPSMDEPFTRLDNGTAATKRKRRPAGTPDPDAEVVSLSPRTLMESDRYVCEICNQGFQRDQNLQMHRRRHKVPWKLLKREEAAGSGGGGAAATRKRVYVCPEPSCLHHDPCHALGDLVGIKKHFRRKHSSHRQWVCARCSKAYAVQSDFKAHLKTCGTRGHSCDCGRVFSRVESFIEHQDSCNMGRLRPSDSQNNLQPSAPPCLSQTASSPSPISEQTNMTTAPWPPLPLPKSDYKLDHPNNLSSPKIDHSPRETYQNGLYHNLELQLSIGSSDMATERNISNNAELDKDDYERAMEEKARAEEARRESKREVEEAEREFENARMIRQQAQVELNTARAMREQARRHIDMVVLQVTCRACKQSYLSSIT